jgi:hypothetical protein
MLLTVGCSKSRSPEPEGGPATNPPAGDQSAGPSGRSRTVREASATSNTLTGVSTNDDRTAAGGAPEPVRRVATLQSQYRAAREFDDRFEAAIRLGEVGTAEAVSALEELFRTEPAQELRVELINALIGISGCKEERLRFLKLGVAAGQPSEVREAALDGLVDLEDARALALLKELRDDPDEKVRTLARQSHDLLEQMLK